jgi:hypothetical protein
VIAKSYQLFPRHQNIVCTVELPVANGPLGLASINTSRALRMLAVALVGAPRAVARPRAGFGGRVSRSSLRRDGTLSIAAYWHAGMTGPRTREILAR